MSRNKIIILLLISLVACPNVKSETAQNSESNLVGATNFPAYSWDKIPLYMHGRKATAFTTNELNYLAEFPLITLEKTTGSTTYLSTEDGSIAAAKAIKAINPNAKILYYRNVIVHYDTYNVNASLETITEPYLKNKYNGSVLNLVGTSPGYDLTNPLVRKWWVEHCVTMSQKPEIDGIFVDGNVKVLTDSYLLYELGQTKKNQLVTGYEIMMDSLRTKMNSDKIRFANLIRATLPDAGISYMNYFDGTYLENFTGDKNYYAKGIAAAQSVARSGKIVAFTFDLDAVLTNPMPVDQNGYVILTTDLQNKFNFLLAVYLICAEQYSYFLMHDGYNINLGVSALWLQKFAEYDKPLGAPTGQAIKNGYVYTRKFQNVDVTLNLNTMTGVINWKSTLTNTIEDQDKWRIYSKNGKIRILGTDSGKQIEVYDVVGNKVWSGEKNSESIEIQLPKGIYLIAGYRNLIYNY